MPSYIKTKNPRTNIAIDGKALRAALDEGHHALSSIERYVLIDCGNSYLRSACLQDSIRPDYLEKICTQVLKRNMEDFLLKEEAKETKNAGAVASTDELVITMSQIFNKMTELISEIKTLQIQNKEQATVNKQMVEMMKQINSNINTSTEKIKAIYTDVHYNK